jgi:ceramide glucosyltransferase
MEWLTDFWGAAGGFFSLLLLPVAGGSFYSLLTVAALLSFSARRAKAPELSEWPAVTLLKPIHGLDKDLEPSLRSACNLDYPAYQVLLSVQTEEDPALPLLQRLAKEFGPDRVTLVVGKSPPYPNGKIENLVGAMPHARHDVLVISDSDVTLRPDYLKTIVAPLQDASVGYVCTLYRGIRAQSLCERLELLSLHDFTVNVAFAKTTGASDYCLGSSMAFHRNTLEAIGGFAPLGPYLVEDFEMGRRIQALGLRPALAHYTVETVIDLKSPGQWWNHQLYWDQNTRGARPIGFFATVLIKAVPFATLFAIARLFDPFSLALLGATLGLRIATAAINLALLHDREGLRNLAWLPLRDIAALASWAGAMRRRSVVWRGVEYDLTRDFRLSPHRH